MACVSGLTNGVYSYTDCCGQLQAGISIGESICLDETFSGSSYGVYIATGQTCSQNCIQGGLSYQFSVTGVCNDATGSVAITPYGGAPSYTIDNIVPGTVPTQFGTSTITFTGLTGGTYVFRLNDAMGLQNNEIYINVNITPCFDANIINASGTTCGDDNGFLQVTATTSGAPYTILLYKDNNLSEVVNTQTLPYDFTGLGEGIYYATIYDYGSTTGNTENAVISASTSVDFGFWKVNTSNCVIDKGKIAVTGVTGNGPYTYLWSNGETGQLITGLTQGSYSCTVTDSLGCETTKSEVIGVAEPLGLVFLTSDEPSCFGSDGSLTFTVSGGSVPLYFSATSAQVGYTLSDTFTITGLSSNNYQVLVRDGNFCETILSGYLSPVNGFNVVGTTVTNSSCDINNGSIDVTIQGVSGFYVYSLSGQSSGAVYGNVSQNQSYSFTNLPNDSYLLVISGTGSNCVYSTNVDITSTAKFEINVSTTGSTCGQNNGTALVQVSTGYTSPLDYVVSNGNTIIDTPLSSVTYNNLVAGTYSIKITDADGCMVTTGFTITDGGSLVSSIATTNCTNGSDGSASVIVYEGEPPFTYLWSNGQTGVTATNLSGGTYTVLVSDSSGCTNTQFATITCVGGSVGSYQIYTMCDNTFTTTTGNQRGLIEMLNEGFIDITSGYTNCILNSAIFTCDITLNGSAFTQTFYTATTLNDVPQDIVWQETIESMLSGITQIQSYQVDLLNNTLTLTSKCVGDEDPLSDADFSLELNIIYDVECDGPGPAPACDIVVTIVTPTPTPTISPTPTPTISPTPTTTPTSTPTPTISPTPTATSPVSDDLCVAPCSLGFDTYSANTIGQLVVGSLTGGCGTISSYVIYWYDSVGDVELVSGYGTEITGFTNYTVTHPLTNSSSPPMPAGTYEPVLQSIVIGGVTYTSTGSGTTTQANLDCLTGIEITIEPFSCTNCTEVGHYKCRKTYETTPGSTVAPGALSTTFELDPTQPYFAYSINGETVPDKLKITFVNQDGTNYNDPIVVEYLEIGSDIVGDTNLAITTLPKRIETSFFTNAYYGKPISLTGFTINSGDYLIIELIPNTGVTQTSWDLYFTCLEEFNCDTCLETNPIFKISADTITQSLNSCNQLSVSATIVGCPSYANEDIFKFMHSVSNPYLSTTFQTLYLQSGYQNIGGGNHSFNTIGFTPTCSPNGGGAFGTTCQVTSGETITVNKTGQLITITCSSITDRDAYYNSYLARYADLPGWPSGTPSVTSTDYYYHVTFADLVPLSVGSTCGDDQYTITLYYIHPLSVVTTGGTTGAYTMTIDMEIITNQYPLSSCDGCYNSVNTIVNRINNSANSSNVNHTSNNGLRYGLPVLGTGGVTYNVPTLPSSQYVATLDVPYYSTQTLPYSGNPLTFIPELSATTCDFSWADLLVSDVGRNTKFYRKDLANYFIVMTDALDPNSYEIRIDSASTGTAIYEKIGISPGTILDPTYFV